MSEGRAGPGRWSRLLIVPPVVIGLVVLLVAVRNRAPLPAAPVEEMTRAVRVIPVPRMAVVPTVLGHGVVRPERTWNAVAEVAGRVLEMDARLLDGAILPGETELVRIDPARYELNLAQLEAEQAELDTRERNNLAALEIERRSLEVSRGELERVRQLVTRSSVARTDVDVAERAMLVIRQSVQNLESIAALLPAERRLLETRIAQARLDLENTSIVAPFDLRIASLDVERNQYVSIGQRLFEGQFIERVEIEVQVSLGEARALFIERPNVRLSAEFLASELPRLSIIDPVVRMAIGTIIAEWPARFIRMSSIDPATRSVGVVVAVDRPFELAVPGKRPPLVAGMFVDVLLRGRTLDDRVVVPRAAVRAGGVYLVDEASRLERRPVAIAFSQGSASIVDAGLDGGETLVVTDLVPAIDGMLMTTELDEALARRLRYEVGAVAPPAPTVEDGAPRR